VVSWKTVCSYSLIAWLALSLIPEASTQTLLQITSPDALRYLEVTEYAHWVRCNLVKSRFETRY
jgi:hypothetical protein